MTREETREEFIDIVCDLLRKKRKEKGLTQKDLAKRINVTQGQISQWENSRMLQMSTIEKIALALDCSFVNFISEYIDSNGKWIPVSERLPEKDGSYLVCMSWNYYYMDVLIWADGWNCTRRINGKVDRKSEIDGADIIAWMPLPEPYREDGE